LMKTEGVTLKFKPDAIKRIAEISWQVNENIENIGARRLHTVMEHLLEDISYGASDKDGETFTIDVKYVDKLLKALSTDKDLSRYIL